MPVPRIGLVVPGLTEIGGVATVARFLKDAILADGRYQLTIVSLSMSSRDPCNVSLRRPSTWLRGPLVSQGTWDDLPYTHVGSVAGELEFQRFRPRAVLADAVRDCDVLQVVSGIPAWANPVLGLGKPVALQTATLVKVERRRLSAGVGLAARVRKAMAYVIDPIDRRALRRVDAIQVENPWMLDLARSLNVGRAVDIRYAPPGVDADRFHPLAERQPTADPYILCVGRLDDTRKNVLLLLEAFARVAKQQDRVRLVLAGAAGPPERFSRRASELRLADRVRYVANPSADELVALYQRATAFALPSHEEGLGLVLLEAMACGVPVVSTRSGGPDGIIADGQNGFLVDLDDRDTLAVRLLQLCDDAAINVAIGRRGRETVEQRYSKSAAAKPFLEIWDRLRCARRR